MCNIVRHIKRVKNILKRNMSLAFPLSPPPAIMARSVVCLAWRPRPLDGSNYGQLAITALPSLKTGYL